MIQNYIRQSVQDIWFSLYNYRLLIKRNRLLMETDFKGVHEAMKKELLIKKHKVINTWCDIIRRVDKHKNSSNAHTSNLKNIV